MQNEKKDYQWYDDDEFLMNVSDWRIFFFIGKLIVPNEQKNSKYR